MARAKKEAALTPEERLQAALVPDWEWPYKLPENWCWTYLTKVAECLDNFRKPINATERAGRNGNVPYYGATGQVGWIDDFLTDENLVLLGEDGAPFLDLIKDKAYLISGKAWVNNHAHILRSPFGDTGNRYLLHYLNSFNYADYVNGTTRLKLTQTSMDTIPIPFSPLAEQQRIVDRIESLFSKLDEAKEKAQAVVDSFETRKAAILHKAFTGELTAKWREEHGVGMESWEKKSVDELCGSLKYGTAKRSNAYGSVVVLRMGNLQQGEIDWSDLAYSNDPDDIEKYKLFPGDVLFNRTNSAALVGKTAIYRGEHPAIYAGYLIKLDYDHDKIIGDYLNYALNTLDAKKYCNSVKTDGVNQSNINAKKIGAYSFNVSSIPEQEKIVAVIQRLLSKEQQSKEAAEAVLDQINLMKKSILARAFRGELGTNDPSEESSVELLKQVIEQEDGDVIRPKAKAKRIAIPAEIKPLLSGANEEAIVKLLLKAAPQSVSTQTVMSISKKKFELMDALRNLEKKQIVSKSDSGEYSLVR
mgnify:CR=1 FL=1